MGTGRSLEKRKIDSQKLYSAKQLSKIFGNNGNSSSSEEPQTTSWKIKFMRILDAATDTEQSHHILSDLMSPGTYYRLNPYLTEMVSMTEYRVEKLRQLEKDAHMYFRRNEDKFEELAEKLVKPRNSIRAIKDVITKNILY
jgi:calcium-independent phospholipase A2-gamma